MSPNKLRCLPRSTSSLVTFPHGLTGRWAHKHGKDVMDYLLSQVNESCVCVKAQSDKRDRHRVYCAVGMDKPGADLAGSLGKGKKPPMQSTTGNNNTTKRKAIRKAPALHSPAGMLALLALAYPDLQYHQRIEQLQIGWMTEDQETLNVREGYRKGITSENIGTVFSANNKPPLGAVVGPTRGLQPTVWEGLCCAAVETSDPIYPRMLAHRMWCWRVPLTMWVRWKYPVFRLLSCTPPRNPKARQGPQPPRMLSTCVNTFAPPLMLTDELEDWLAGKILGMDDSMVLYSWCLHREVRMRAAPHYQPQLLTSLDPSCPAAKAPTG